MSIQDTVGVYDAAEFAENPEPRCPIVLVLDSGIPTDVPIENVRQGLLKFRDVLREDPVAALRADVAVIEFGNEARVIQDFTNGADFEPPDLSITSDLGYYAQAINLTLDVIEARKRSYQENGIAYYRALVYFLTNWWGARAASRSGQFIRDQYGFMYEGFDQGVFLGHLGHRYEHSQTGELAQAVLRLSEMEQNRSVAFFSFFTNPGLNGVAGLVGYASYIERVAWLAGVSVEEFRRTTAITAEQLHNGTVGISVDDLFMQSGITVEQLHNGTVGLSVEDLLRSGNDCFYSTERAAALAGISESEFIEMGVREGIIWTAAAGLSKLSPPHRPPVLLTNVEQLEGSIQWLSRSVAAVSQSQPGDSIRLPQQDFRNL